MFVLSRTAFIVVTIFSIVFILQLGWYLIFILPAAGSSILRGNSKSLRKKSNNDPVHMVSQSITSRNKDSTASRIMNDDAIGVQQISVKDAIASFNETKYIMGEPKYEDPYKRNSFNLTASDNIPSNRHIPDTRHQLCVDQVYSESLPSTSVIICFHNEARSTLLRTVISVLNRSPPSLIHEIILVDDFSDDPNDGILLEALPKVKVLRNNAREGLIRSRIAGADYASAPVLTFLDSHCECNVGWLEPLLQRIMENRNIIVSPVIEIIDLNTFRYKFLGSDSKGVFDFALTFKWGIVTETTSPVDPIRTPTIAGGLFSINRQRFIETGKYDEGMDVWGGENLEISFRTWMCGGSMEIIPCSRVGHVFRNSHPYKFPNGSSKTINKNTLRTAVVWLDEYIAFFYSAKPSARNQDYGNVDERIALRKRLNCTTFNWYMKNVNPELDIPDHMNALLSSLRLMDYCMSAASFIGVGKSVAMYRCSTDGTNKRWIITSQNTIRNADNMCLTVGTDSALLLRKCIAGSTRQTWEISNNNKTIQSLKMSGYCLSGDRVNTMKVLLTLCDSDSAYQQWNIKPQKLKDFVKMNSKE